MKVMTIVDPKVLDHYNRVMDENYEETYMIESGDIHDCSRDTLIDTAWAEANPDAPVSGPDCPPDPDEYTFGSDYLIEEMRYNLLEKQRDIMEDSVHFGEMTKQKMIGTLRKYKRLVDEFKKLCSDTPDVDPWFVDEIER